MYDRLILAFDPGGTTGVCRLEYVEQKPLESKLTWDFLPPEGHLRPHHLPLWDLLDKERFDTYSLDIEYIEFDLVWEAFNYQRRELDKGVSLVLDSKEYIGILKLFRDKYQIPNWAEQQPSTMKLWDDKKIDRVCERHPGIKYVPKAPAHARDAMRHMLYYVTATLKDDSWIRFARP